MVVLVVDALNLDAQCVIALRARRTTGRIGLVLPVAVIRRWGDRQHAADRLDPEPVPMGVDVRHHRGYLLRRSSAAWAKYADAVLRISFVRFSSRFSRSSAASRSRSLVVRPGCWPVSRSACRTHFRSVSAVQPSFVATDCSAAHSDGCAARCSSPAEWRAHAPPAKTDWDVP